MCGRTSNKTCGLGLGRGQSGDREACLGDVQGLRSDKGGRRAEETISRGLVGVVTVAHVIRLTCQSWAPTVRVTGGQLLTQSSCPACLCPTNYSVPTQAVQIGSPCKPLKETAFKDLPDCIPGYRETAGQVAKSHHRK